MRFLEKRGMNRIRNFRLFTGLRLRACVLLIPAVMAALASAGSGGHAFASTTGDGVETHLYWTHSGGIGRANLDGSAIKADFISGIDPDHIAVNSSYIYWGSRGDLTVQGDEAIGRADLDGGGVETNLIPGASVAGPLAVDDAHVYWITANGGIGRANLDGSGADNNFIPGGPSSPINSAARAAIAVDESDIYWLTAFGISRANLDGSMDSPQRGLIQIYYPGDLALFGGYLNWTRASGRIDPPGLIGCAPSDGSGAVDPWLTKPGGYFNSIAADGSHLYWTSAAFSTGGSTPSQLIGRASLDGTAVEPGFLSVPGAPPGDLALDPSPGSGRCPPRLSNRFGIGRLKRDLKRGTARLPVTVPGPGRLDLRRTGAVSGDYRFHFHHGVPKAGTVWLMVQPVGTARQKLRATGRLRVRLHVEFQPSRGPWPGTRWFALGRPSSRTASVLLVQ
jgi:hypothetical protein